MTTMTENEITQHLQSLPDWEQVEVGGQPAIRKAFKTGDFLKGLGFVTRVAVLAEKDQHHPDVFLTYPAVTVCLTTHDVGGLSSKDFQMAKQIDNLAV